MPPESSTPIRDGRKSVEPFKSANPSTSTGTSTSTPRKSLRPTTSQSNSNASSSSPRCKSTEPSSHHRTPTKQRFMPSFLQPTFSSTARSSPPIPSLSLSPSASPSRNHILSTPTTLSSSLARRDSYIASLQSEIEGLKFQKKLLQERNERLEEGVKKMGDEIEGMKGVFGWQREIMRAVGRGLKEDVRMVRNL